MNFNKPMIDLVRELRKRAPSDEKPGIKLANPDLLFEMIPWYHGTRDVIVKALIKELFEHAGDNWPQRLNTVNHADKEPSGQEAGKRYITRVYRGQTQLVEVAAEPRPPENPVTRRVYRGQVVRG